MRTLGLTVLVSVLISAALASQQAVGVEGKLMCGQRPAEGISVMLYDHDTADPDDLIQEGVTDVNGYFKLQGSERELTPIDPYVKAYHDCDDGIMPGQRKIKFHIPQTYISPGGVPKRLFQLGVLNLETIFPGEGRNYL